MDNLSESVVRADSHSHHICIDPEGEMIEPHSPKHMTESSSKFNATFAPEFRILRLVFCDSKQTKLPSKCILNCYRFSVPKSSHIQTHIANVLLILLSLRYVATVEKMNRLISERMMIKVCSSHSVIRSTRIEWLNMKASALSGHFDRINMRRSRQQIAWSIESSMKHN